MTNKSPCLLTLLGTARAYLQMDACLIPVHLGIADGRHHIFRQKKLYVVTIHKNPSSLAEENRRYAV